MLFMGRKGRTRPGVKLQFPTGYLNLQAGKIRKLILRENEQFPLLKGVFFSLKNTNSKNKIKVKERKKYKY